MRIAKLWFWITPLSCVSSIFLFAFGVSAFSYFLTGQETVDMWTVLKVLETLPDPREFISANMVVFNKIYGYANENLKTISLTETTPNWLEVLISMLNILIRVLKGIIYVVAFIVMLILTFVTFPIYCVFFTFRCCASMLVLIGVDVPQNMYNISLDQIFNDLFNGGVANA